MNNFNINQKTNPKGLKKGECDIDCVPNKARVKKVNIALNNGFAFGGNNSCLVIGKFLK